MTQQQAEKPPSATADESTGGLSRIDITLTESLQWLFRHQAEAGFWEGAVRTNAAMEAEWLLAGHILNTELPVEEGAIRGLFVRQRPDGAWDVYPGAPDGDINATVEVYAALRAKGYSADQPELKRARDWILEHGGLAKVRVFTRYWLAMIGVWPWTETPNLPPEIIRFPLWFPFNIYNFSQWARATLVPLTVVAARRPVWPLPDGSRLEELFPGGREDFQFAIPAKNSSTFSLENFFQKLDGALHWLQSRKLVPARENAIKLCLEWMLRHQDSDGAWGGIQPPWIYGLIALHNEGYAIDHPVLAKGLATLEGHWSNERDGGTLIQATNSPVWDTLFSLLALSESAHSVTGNAAMRKGMQWILDKQVLVKGDWAMKEKDLAPGGWSFEHANLAYPDLDDTALALLVLAQSRGNSADLRPAIEKAIERAANWVFGMQCGNGGWASFDKDNNKQIISKIPFANFGEALDPPSADVTGHMLEALAALGYKADHPDIARALDFMLGEQEPDGSWFGRWGVNYLYGTGAVLPALRALNQDMSAGHVQRAAAWLLDRQNNDGGWGEHCASYMDADHCGRGGSTPSQTGWALLALIAVGGERVAPAIRAGVITWPARKPRTAPGMRRLTRERAFPVTG